jgi:hypothetical protein
MRVKYLIPFLILALVFGFVPACSETPVEEVIEEPAVEEVIEEEAIEEIQEEIKEEPPEKDLSKEEFLESIKDYDITLKAWEYSSIVLQICKDSIDFEEEVVLLTDNEIASRYLELAGQIRDDSFFLGFLKGRNEEEEKIIELMDTWFDKMEKSYEYLANYYWGDGAIYEIKSDELQEEADEIQDEYNKMLGEYLNEK